jgi:hypothetical protein
MAATWEELYRSAAPSKTGDISTEDGMGKNPVESEPSGHTAVSSANGGERRRSYAALMNGVVVFLALFVAMPMLFNF